ncbi:tail fiber protein [Marinomonas sp. FW-1]|uniref:tail fiber protein n=1 Tax=Marinomonas sp. FW-1 TaxID=2071621 RepID=UPI0010C082AE
MKNKTQLSLFSTGTVAFLLTGFSLTWSPEAEACGPESYIGEVCLTAANFCPERTVEANGALMDISANTALFSLLSCQYGGIVVRLSPCLIYEEGHQFIMVLLQVAPIVRGGCLMVIKV